MWVGHARDWEALLQAAHCLVQWFKGQTVPTIALAPSIVSPLTDTVCLTSRSSLQACSKASLPTLASALTHSDPLPFTFYPLT